MNDFKSPCMGCRVRHLHCHSECIAYIEWDKKHQKHRHELSVQKEINNLIRDNELKRFKDIKFRHKGKGLGRKKK